MSSNFTGPVNLGSERMISINNLVYLIAELIGKEVNIQNVPGPMGVMGRNSDNRLIREKLNWAPQDNLEDGLLKTYDWILEQIEQGKQDDK
jgi:nucleoside-diphosphate-sugar epimerase